MATVHSLAAIRFLSAARLQRRSPDILRACLVLTFTLVVLHLSLRNAIHTPLFDGMRAGTYFLRTRKGPMTSLVRDESRVGCNIYRSDPAIDGRAAVSAGAMR